MKFLDCLVKFTHRCLNKTNALSRNVNQRQLLFTAPLTPSGKLFHLRSECDVKFNYHNKNGDKDMTE